VSFYRMRPEVLLLACCYQNVRRGTGCVPVADISERLQNQKQEDPLDAAHPFLDNAVRIDPWHRPINNGFDRPLRSLP